MAAMRLGELLVKAGLVTDSQLRIALAHLKTHGGRLGEHFIQVGVLTEVELARALAKQSGIAYTDAATLPPPSVAKLLGAEDALRLQALPVSLERGQLSVAFGDVDEDARDEVARLIGRPIVPLVAPQVALRRAIERVYSAIDLKDEGTSEFQLFDSRGLGKVVKVGGQGDDDLPEVSVMELSAITGNELPSLDYDEPAPPPRAPPPRAPPPRAPPPRAPPPRAPQPGAPQPRAPQPGAPQPRAPPPGAPPPGAPPPGAPPPRAPPANPALARPADAAGEEALRLLWSLADLLVEKGFVSRAELMAKLRK